MVVSDLGDIALMAHELPARAEDGLLLELEKLGVVVDPRREAECVFVHRRSVLKHGIEKAGRGA
jgi:hypothetical protein